MRKRSKHILIIILSFMLLVSCQKDNNEQLGNFDYSTNQNEIKEVIMVDIKGEVFRPGVYQIKSGTYLFDLIELAGGATYNADMNKVNLATQITSNQMIIIPRKKEEDIEFNYININTADMEELCSLTGIGSAKARRIIEYRQTTPFQKIEDIMNVSGIGLDIFEKIKSFICV